jgi:hypothetical protein
MSDACEIIPIQEGDRSVSLPFSDEKEVALRQSWAVDKLIQQREVADDLIAKLARRVIDHYLFFQARLQGGPDCPESIDELTRLSDECRHVIQTNLPLFLGLSAQGRNIHSLIDERILK